MSGPYHSTIISPQLKRMILLKSGCIFWSFVSWDASSGRALALPVLLDQLVPSKNMWGELSRRQAAWSTRIAFPEIPAEHLKQLGDRQAQHTHTQRPPPSLPHTDR